MLAAWLGYTVNTLTQVRLRGLPRVDHFADDYRQIADKFGVKVEVLEGACWSWWQTPPSPAQTSNRTEEELRDARAASQADDRRYNGH